MSMSMTSLGVIKFPVRRECEIWMLSQLSGGWPFIRVHTETAFAKIIRLRRQVKVIW